MITQEHCHNMARYNRWQNQSLFGAADGISDEARRLDRGAFFGLIHRTLNHLLWADVSWMSRFDDWSPPDVYFDDAPDWIGEWTDMQARRVDVDARIYEWSQRVATDDLMQKIHWIHRESGKDVEAVFGYAVNHMFNHQTHHRGQANAMVTAAGGVPRVTDFFMMPADA